MPLMEEPAKYQWVDPPGMETTLIEYDGKFYQLVAKKKFSDEHHLSLEIYKTWPGKDHRVCMRLVPLVVGLWETDGDKSSSDFYAFDYHGYCLIHTHSESENGKTIVDEAQDRDVSRLIEHGELISEMIDQYPASVGFHTNTAVMDLSSNCLTNHYPAK